MLQQPHLQHPAALLSARPECVHRAVSNPGPGTRVTGSGRVAWERAGRAMDPLRETKGQSVIEGQRKEDRKEGGFARSLLYLAWSLHYRTAWAHYAHFTEEN